MRLVSENTEEDATVLARTLVARQPLADLERLYGYRSLHLEMLVEGHSRGTSYRAAKWSCRERRAEAGWTSTSRLTGTQ